VHFALGNDGRYRIERRHDAQPAIIVEPEIAIFGRGILPRDHEYGVAPLHQVFDQ
jgi:hypothetical protein